MDVCQQEQDESLYHNVGVVEGAHGDLFAREDVEQQVHTAEEHQIKSAVSEEDVLSSSSNSNSDTRSSCISRTESPSSGAFSSDDNKLKKIYKQDQDAEMALKNMLSSRRISNSLSEPSSEDDEPSIEASSDIVHDKDSDSSQIANNKSRKKFRQSSCSYRKEHFFCFSMGVVATLLVVFGMRGVLETISGAGEDIIDVYDSHQERFLSASELQQAESRSVPSACSAEIGEANCEDKNRIGINANSEKNGFLAARTENKTDVKSSNEMNLPPSGKGNINPSNIPKHADASAPSKSADSTNSKCKVSETKTAPSESTEQKPEEDQHQHDLQEFEDNINNNLVDLAEDIQDLQDPAQQTLDENIKYSCFGNPYCQQNCPCIAGVYNMLKQIELYVLGGLYVLGLGVEFCVFKHEWDKWDSVQRVHATLVEIVLSIRLWGY